MRSPTTIIALLLALIQYPLWFGEGGWFKVWEREKQLVALQKINEEWRLRNAALEAEVHDLRTGTSAIEERARYELGMVKNDEIFVHIVDKPVAGTQ